MSEITEEEIARAILHEEYGCAPEDVPNLYAKALATARLVMALVLPAIERARVELTDEQDHLLMCAVENLRSADRNDRTVEAAWRMAEKMEAWRKAAAIRKG